MTPATAVPAAPRSMPAGFPSDITLDPMSVQLLAMLERYDPAAARLFAQEAERQATTLELIASENHVSTEVMHSVGSWLTNKYAEGYPGKRYYGGCEYVDVAEQLAIDRVKQLFGADAANVQPHCGASANEAVFLAFLKPGDTIVRVDPRYFRPAEVETLLGDATKARQKLGWTAEISIAEMIREMVAHDLDLAKRSMLLRQNGFQINTEPSE